LFVKGINKLNKKKEEAPAPAAPPAPSKEELLLAEIRDLLKAKNNPNQYLQQTVRLEIVHNTFHSELFSFNCINCNLSEKLQINVFGCFKRAFYLFS